MVADSLIATRVTASTKERFAALARSQGLSESALLKRFIDAALLTAVLILVPGGLIFALGYRGRRWPELVSTVALFETGALLRSGCFSRSSQSSPISAPAHQYMLCSFTDLLIRLIRSIISLAFMFSACAIASAVASTS